MSKSICKAYKKNRNDELYTPRILVECLKSYFDKWVEKKLNFCTVCEGINYPYKKITVWTPFDKENSEFVLFFKELGCNVIFSHIDNGKDFFEYEPDNYDIIISNPPFSRKLDVFKRCNELNKPWVMLSNIMCLNYMEIGDYFINNPIQLLIPNKRVSFDGNPSSFCSGYFCKDFLPRQLMFVSLPHCNSGKNYIPSRMYNI
jgi:hypothetical protein